MNIMLHQTINFECPWPGNDALLQAYHDNEWGKPEHDDNKLFELFVLEGFQAGLSWRTVLHKRENFRLAFDNFDAQKIALYDEYKFAELMQNKGIIRNRLKIAATITNAQAFLNLKAEGISFDQFVWQFTNFQTIDEQYISMVEVPCSSPESLKMSKALLAKGFRFAGPTICYSFMQAIAMVNDHLKHCTKRHC